MKGTNKQINWASDIRDGIISVMTDAINTFAAQAASNPIVQDNIDGLQERINRLSSDDVYAGDIIDLFCGVHLTGDCNADLGAVMSVYNVSVPATTGQRWLLVKETKEDTLTTNTTNATNATTHTSVKSLWDEICSWDAEETLLETLTDEDGNEVNIILQTCRDANGKVVDNSVMAVNPRGTLYPEETSKLVKSAIKRIVDTHNSKKTATIYITQDADMIQLGRDPIVTLDEPPEISRDYIRRLLVELPDGYTVNKSQDCARRIYREGDPMPYEIVIDAQGELVLLDSSTLPARHVNLTVFSEGWDE